MICSYSSDWVSCLFIELMFPFAVHGGCFPLCLLIVCVQGFLSFLPGFSDPEFTKLSHLEVEVWLGGPRGGGDGEPGLGIQPAGQQSRLFLYWSSHGTQAS